MVEDRNFEIWSSDWPLHSSSED